MKNVAQVNQYLADLSVWNVKLHNLHFNVVGPQFKSIHEYLESVYDVAFDYFDAVAEAVKMAGQFPLVNSKEYAALSKIEELGQADIPQAQVIEILLNDFKYMKDQALAIRSVASEEDHFALSNMMEDHVEYYVKQIWFIESMLK
ncbi:DNA starvation/stationary phase protection protein [Veillonella caviae]|uniref:Dps family protein n=1 Tax=Veillonella caviae TaxID=248316 RepID=UPI0023A7C845|nr:DNA starvation/stationary phase protection protein [Veillonella caviae]MCI5707956.1 DNA starvation/stationary phase protection protein [Veillonella caviae]MCI7694338.1 DNA starvation/stationary phase protection protein [Veillonella caviae]MDY5254282.1 DNA starvation/stationary phase protection protein [Veillonella caviae]MDY5409650.1 DNA starvation/stationary phase protection protein [Veillonella caviae]MDY5715599.1 DNA starvation/stationary phase protection protein [Veillonella caviae]